MTARRLSLALSALVLMLAGCGQNTGQRAPDLSRLPLLPGARIVAQSRVCDRGANAFCALELVVVDAHSKSSDALLLREHAYLKQRGWSGADADTGQQRAADSPGHKLRVTYATAFGDLLGINFRWIHRTHKITLALSHAMFFQSAALSMMLEQGST